MKKTILIILGIMFLSIHCLQSKENNNTNEDMEFEQAVQVQNKDSVEIIVGEAKLVIHKKDDYNYKLVARPASGEITESEVFTGFSPSHIYYDDRYFVMDADYRNPCFIVYDAQKNSFEKYDGYYATTMSFRLIDKKLYVGYFSFDEQAGSLLIIDLETNLRTHINNIDDETITSAEIKATEKAGKVYILMDYSSDQKVFSIENDEIKSSDIKINDSFENKTLEGLFK